MRTATPAASDVPPPSPVEDNGPKEAGAYYSGSIDAMGWLNLDRAGPLDVAVTISFASEIWKRAPSEDRCKENAEAMQHRLKDSAQRDLLEFLSSGTGYVPSPATKRILDVVNAQMTYTAPRSRPASHRSVH